MASACKRSLTDRALALAIVQGYYDGQLAQLTKRHQQRLKRRKGPDERVIITGQALPEPGEQPSYSLMMYVNCTLPSLPDRRIATSLLQTSSALPFLEFFHRTIRFYAKFAWPASAGLP